MKHIRLSAIVGWILVGCGFVFMPFQALAGDNVIFRIDRSPAGCYPMSLNETLSAKVTGKTGSGCDFTLDVVAAGEWMNNGAYFDSPPYAWGTDTFYPGGFVNGSSGANDPSQFSFTCQSPSYSLDTKTLPTYITVTKDEAIPATANAPAGRRYYFSVEPGAVEKTTFNANLGFTTSCDMKTRGGKTEGVMESVVDGNSSCQNLGLRTINPRGATLHQPITIGATCLQQMLPTNTPTITPTKAPACNDSCDPADNKCPTNTCGLCQKNIHGVYTCQPPPPTPTLTPKPPACGDACNPADNQCPQPGTAGSCNVCAKNAAGKNVCQPPPSCGQACDPANGLTCPNQCPACSTGTGGTKICQAPSPTPTKAPACNDSCDPADNKCPTNTCGLCQQNIHGVYTCQPPPPTPTLTPKPPACGDTCNPTDNQCPQPGTAGSCNVCAKNAAGKNVCQPPPSCGQACNPAGGLTCPNECPVCSTGTGGSKICQPPSPTPTPHPTEPLLPHCGQGCTPSNNQCPNECPACAPGSGSSGTICQAPSPTPTATPRPTSTPLPTSTPMPTSTPLPKCGETCVAGNNKCPQECPVCATAPGGGTNTVCRAPASCNCDGFQSSGDIGKGKTVTFTTFVKVDDPDTNDAKAKEVVFHVEANGVEIAKSDPVPASAPSRTTDAAGKPIDRYSASWSYTIPTTGSGTVEYHVFGKITCTYKSLGDNSCSPDGMTADNNQTCTNTTVAQNFSTVRVLAAETTENVGFFGRILRFFRRAFSFAPAAPTPAPVPATPTPVNQINKALGPGDVGYSAGVKSLKLGTLNMSELTPSPSLIPTPTIRIEKACKEVRFWIVY